MHFHQHPVVAMQLVHDRAAGRRAVQQPPALRVGAARAVRWRAISGLVMVLAVAGLAIVATAHAAPTVICSSPAP